jgi:hypothetical protein
MTLCLSYGYFLKGRLPPEMLNSASINNKTNQRLISHGLINRVRPAIYLYKIYLKIFASGAAAVLLFTAACAFSSPSFAAPSQSNYFGFYEVEFYKGSNLALSLKTSDINGDGLEDITFLDVEKSQIAMFINSARGGPAVKSPVSEETELNSVKYDDRFARFNVALERKIYDYEFIKLKDQTMESLIVLSEPGWLILYVQDENMQFHEYYKLRLDESNYSKAQISRCDFDNDGLEDILIMCPDFFAAAPNLGLNDFARAVNYIPIGAEYGSEPSRFGVFDLNADGFNDIVYSYPARSANLRVKFGAAGGVFLEEESYDLLNFNEMDFIKLKSGDKRAAKLLMGCVLETSNRVHAYEINNKPGALKDKNIKLSAAYFNKDDKNPKNIISINDFNSDGAPDIAVINPEQGRLGVYFYSSGNKITAYKNFSFSARVNGAFSVKSKEADIINIIAFTGERILKAKLNSKSLKYEFPKPADECGSVFWAAPYKAADKSEKIAMLVKESGEVFIKSADCDLHSAPESNRVDHGLDGASGLKIISDDGGGISCFIVYFKYDGAKVFIKNNDGVFKAADFADKNPAASIKEINSAVCFYDDGKAPELIYGDKNIIRIYEIDRPALRVVQKDQLNISAADFACGCLHSSGGVIYVYDAESKRLFEYDTATKERKINSIEKKISGAGLYTLNGRPVLISGSSINTIIEKPSLSFDKFVTSDYEDIKNGKYNNLIAKDINGDGECDLILTCGSQNYLDIFNFSGSALKHSLRFKIFNTKQFNQYSSYTKEPQMIVSADFDGDSYNDIAMLIHNKVMIYYSDSPAKPGAAAGTKKGGN